MYLLTTWKWTWWPTCASSFTWKQRKVLLILLSTTVKVISHSDLHNFIRIVVKDKVVEAAKNLPLLVLVANLSMWANLVDPWGENPPTFCRLLQPFLGNQIFHSFKANTASCDTFFQIKVISQ